MRCRGRIPNHSQYWLWQPKSPKLWSQTTWLWFYTVYRTGKLLFTKIPRVGVGSQGGSQTSYFPHEMQRPHPVPSSILTLATKITQIMNVNNLILILYSLKFKNTAVYNSPWGRRGFSGWLTCLILFLRDAKGTLRTIKNSGSGYQNHQNYSCKQPDSDSMQFITQENGCLQKSLLGERQAGSGPT